MQEKQVQYVYARSLEFLKRNILSFFVVFSIMVALNIISTFVLPKVQITNRIVAIAVSLIQGPIFLMIFMLLKIHLGKRMAIAMDSTTHRSEGYIQTFLELIITRMFAAVRILPYMLIFVGVAALNFFNIGRMPLFWTMFPSVVFYLYGTWRMLFVTPLTIVGSSKYWEATKKSLRIFHSYRDFVVKNLFLRGIVIFSIIWLILFLIVSIITKEVATARLYSQGITVVTIGILWQLYALLLGVAIIDLDQLKEEGTLTAHIDAMLFGKSPENITPELIDEMNRDS